MSPVPVADQLAKEILEYREECISDGIDVSPDAFMFQDTHGGPMDRATIVDAYCTRLPSSSACPS
jgi:hypothetical protein